MSVKMRQEVERKIVGAFIDAALAAGYRLSVSLERGYDLDVLGDDRELYALAGPQSLLACGLPA